MQKNHDVQEGPAHSEQQIDRDRQADGLPSYFAMDQEAAQLGPGHEGEKQQPANRTRNEELGTGGNHHAESLGNRQRGEHPSDDALCPPPGQEHVSLADEFLEPDRVEGNEHQGQEREAEDDGPSPGIADQGPHRERDHDGDQKSRVSPLVEICAQSFPHPNVHRPPPMLKLISLLVAAVALLAQLAPGLHPSGIAGITPGGSWAVSIRV